MTLPTPPVPLQPADEYVRALIDILTADAVLSGLLYPDWAPPRASDLDSRVYPANTHLVEDLKVVLPRVLLETTQYPFGTEQEQINLGEVLVYVHTLVPKDREGHAAVIDAVVGRLLVSTPVHTVRIITASMALDGLRRVGRAGGFDDAWEVVTQYRSPFVGVIAT